MHEQSFGSLVIGAVAPTYPYKRKTTKIKNATSKQ